MISTTLSSAFDMAQNLALLVLGMFAYSLLREPLGRAPAWARIGTDSMLFSILVFLTMLRPFAPLPGVQIDLRTVLVACAVLFSGPLVGLVATVAAAVFRLSAGGIAAWAGTIGVFLAYFVAIGLRHWLRARNLELRYRHFLALGVVLSLCMVAGSVALPTFSIALEVVRQTFPTAIVVIPLATVLLGAVILRIDQTRHLLRTVADGAARFRTVLDNLPVGVAIRDTSGRYTLVNKTFRERVGMPEGEIIGLSGRQLAKRLKLDPDMFRTDQQILAGKTITEREPFQIDVNGAREWIVSWNFPIRNAAGEIESIGGTQAIVTDLVEAQRALERREEALHRYQEALLDIVRDDAIKQRRYDDALRLISERAAEALDVAAAAVFAVDIERDVQRCLDVWDRGARAHRLFPPDKWSEFRQLFPDYDRDRVIAIEDVQSDTRLAHRVDYYKSFDVKSMLTAAIHVEGQVRGCIKFIATDRTRSWSVEDIGFARSVAHIVTLVFIDNERQALQSRLQEAAKMEAIGRLASGVAHDFNNLLGSIVGFAGFLVQDLPAGTEQRAYADRIVNACDRGKGLIGQIMTLARSQNIERRYFDLRIVLRECGELLAGSLAKTTRISLEYSSEPLPVYGSDTQLSQVIMNLCVNANDALNGKSGVVTVRLTRLRGDEIGKRADASAGLRRVSVGNVEPGRDYACIEVHDTGCGMSEAVLGRVTEPFFTTKEQGRGTGLGLAVVHSIVASHDGAYWIESAPGQGTSFAVCIPAAISPPVAAEPASREPDVAPRGRERILVVDDQEEVADMLAIGLGRLGYDAIGVNDPIEALRSVTEDAAAWDAVVTDDSMPGMRGLTLIRQIRAIAPDLKIILCTGFDEGTTDGAAQAAGADAFFLKPVAPEQIAAKIRQLKGLGVD